MEHKLKYKVASFLYNHLFPVYKILYSGFKLKQDAHEVDFLRKNIRKGDVVLDIGSNIGFYAAIISDLVGPGGTVHCFEPDKKNFAHLSDRLGKKSNVILNNKAVADKTGKIEIFTSHRLNVDHRTYKPEKFDSSHFIEAISIDDYLKGSSRVDFIKIDIQGAEVSAIKGMQGTLLANKHVKIITELWPHGLESAGSSAGEFITLMKSLDYSAFLVDGNKTVAISAEQAESLGKSEVEFYNVIFRK